MSNLDTQRLCHLVVIGVKGFIVVDMLVRYLVSMLEESMFTLRYGHLLLQGFKKVALVHNHVVHFIPMCWKDIMELRSRKVMICSL